ncbi:MAG: protein-L-isoaspartate O-methyltransferase family protein, partial [Pseudonocardiaceae bacterium]
MNRVSSPEDLARVVRDKGVHDERVLAAIEATPRAQFVPAERAGAAYIDEPIPIAHGQVTTQPSLSARLIEGLHLTGGEHVLEIGTGFGFQTALLAGLAADVVSIERWPDMADEAGRNLARHGIHNVALLVGDGTCGVPDRAPFDV